MRYFRYIFLAMFFVTFIAVLTGAHHQFAMMIICLIGYIVLTPKTQTHDRIND